MAFGRSDPDPPIRLLGSIGAIGPAGPAILHGSRQPALLGLLALAAPALVPCRRLIDGLWGDDPPRTAVRTLHSHIARIRLALDECGLPDILRTREPGYLLDISPADVDVHRFESEARVARAELAAGRTGAAVARLNTVLDLWRGEPFADADPAGWAVDEVARLRRVRLDTLADRWNGELRLGRHAVAAGALQRLLVEYPYHERLVSLAMLALYRDGQPTDALATYQRLRDHLADEFGVDPAPDLIHLHVRILRRDPTLDDPPRSADDEHRPPAAHHRPRPAELPASAGHFTGRRAELAALDRSAAGPGPRVHVIAGVAGIGKTALAVQWGHRATTRFPDGQIFLDLRGYDPDTALTAADALAQILASLDQPDSAIPPGLPARVGLYRSLTRHLKILIVADNAAVVDQVLPLVPSGPDAMLVITSRGRLAALATHHTARVIGLEALRTGDALALLASVLGEGRLAREPGSAERLVELCGRMPLALQIAAAKLVGRPKKTIGDLAAELGSDRRLDELSIDGGSRSVRAVFATAYQSLAPATARTFRRLGLHPGTTASVALAAVVAQATPDEGRRAVEELAATHLLVEVAADRYRFHDLIKLYARERAHLDEDATARDETVARILDWYLAVADGANAIVDRDRDRVVAVLRHPRPSLPFPGDPHRALAFLDGERENLLPVLLWATANGRPDIGWQLTYLLTGFFDSRGHWAQRVVLCRAGVAAAREAGDPGAEGLMRSALGVAHVMTHQYDSALAELRRALILTRDHGDGRGEAHVHNNIAVAYAGTHRFPEAIAAYQRALDLHTAQDRPVGVAVCLNNLGDVCVRMGRSDLGLDHLARALAITRELGNTRLEAAVLSGIGQAYRAQHRWDAAVDHFDQALALRRQAGDRRYETDTLNNLGLTELGRGRPVAAYGHFTRAVTISREIADPHQEAVALAQLGHIHLLDGDLGAATEHLELALATRALAPEAYETAGVYRDLAELARRTGQPEMARQHARQAADLYRRAHATDEADALTALIEDAVGAVKPSASA